MMSLATRAWGSILNKADDNDDNVYQFTHDNDQANQRLNALDFEANVLNSRNQVVIAQTNLEKVIQEAQEGLARAQVDYERALEQLAHHQRSMGYHEELCKVKRPEKEPEYEA